MDYAKERKRLVEWVRQNLTGEGLPVELVGINPLERFPTAILFPVSELDEGIDPASEDEAEDELPDIGGPDHAPPKSNLPPFADGTSHLHRSDFPSMQRART